MPVRLLTQSVVRWPEPEQVLREVRDWAQEQAGRVPSLELLPLSCDALVLTPSEHEALMAAGSRFAVELERDARWLWP